MEYISVHFNPVSYKFNVYLTSIKNHLTVMKNIVIVFKHTYIHESKSPSSFLFQNKFKNRRLE